MTAASPPPAIPRWLTAVAAMALLGAGALIVRQVVTSPPPLPVESTKSGPHTAGDRAADDVADVRGADTGASDSAADASAAADADLHGFVLSPAQPAPDVAATEATGAPWRLADRQGKVVALFFGYTSCPDVCPQTLALLAAAKAALGDSADGSSTADAFEVAMITVDPERDTADVLARYMAGFDPSFIGLEAGDGLQSIADAFGATYMRDLPPDLATQAAEIAGHDEAAGGDDHDGTDVAGDDDHADSAAGDDHADDAAGDDPHGGTDAAPNGHSAGVPGGFERGSAAYTVAHSGVVFLIDPAGRLRSSYLAPFDPGELAADVTLLLEGSNRSAKAR